MFSAAFTYFISLISLWTEIIVREHLMEYLKDLRPSHASPPSDGPALEQLELVSKGGEDSDAPC